GLLHAHALARQCAGDEYGLAGVGVAFGAAGDAAAVMAQVGDVEFEGGLVDAGQLLLLPAAAVLVPPAVAGAGDPLAGENVADLRFPFRVAVGDGDFAIHGVAVAVVVGHGLVDGDAVLERELARIADDDQAIAAEAQRAGVEARAQGAVETCFHARLYRLDGGRADGDVGRRLGVGRGDADQHHRVEVERRPAGRDEHGHAAV